MNCSTFKLCFKLNGVLHLHLKIRYHRNKDLIHQSSPTSSGVYIYCRGMSATPVQVYPTVSLCSQLILLDTEPQTHAHTHTTYHSRVYLPSPDNLILWFDSQGRQPSPITASLREFGIIATNRRKRNIIIMQCLDIDPYLSLLVSELLH